ncbi:MAG: anti-sigma factor antagonist [Solirubrobacteraceae bacterium]|jgi:anti-anti-sigma factor|nr:anti-sigma factor antagonist [Solirubrobacteraceae bacterium]
MQSFSIGIEWSGDAVHLHVRGELDVARGGDLVERVEALTDSSARVFLIDLSEVSFIDSSGLRSLLAAQRAVHEVEGLEVLLVRPPRVVRDVMALTGADRLLRVGDAPAPRL